MSTVWTGLWLLSVVGLVLGRAVSGDYVYDDLVLVVDNPGLSDPLDFGRLLAEPLYGVEQGYWRPLTAIVLAWGKALGGAPMLHGIALILHAAVALQVALLGRDLGLRPLVAAAAATLFAVHPSVVEPTAWIASINDPLSVLAALLALRAHLAWRHRGATGVPRAAVTWFVLALLAKENALAILPVLLVAGSFRVRPALVAYALALVAWGLARYAVLGSDLAGVGAEIEGLFAIRFEVTGRLLARLVWPGAATPFTAPTGTLLLALLGAGAAVGFALVAWRTRIESVRLAAVASLAVVLPVAARVEALGPYPVADRYVYLAIAVWAVAVGEGLAGSALRRAWVVLGLVICVVAPVSATRVGVFASPEALSRAGLADHPDDPRLHCMAGEIAFTTFRTTGDRADLARAESAYRSAADHLGQALWNGPEATRVVEADVGLGLAYCALAGASRPDQASAAIAAFERLVAAYPSFGKAWLGLGVARVSSGRRFDALPAFERAVELMPRSFEARVNLGRLLALVGEPGRARAELEFASTLRPGDPLVADLLDALDR